MILNMHERISCIKLKYRSLHPIKFHLLHPINIYGGSDMGNDFFNKKNRIIYFYFQKIEKIKSRLKF